MIEARRAAYTRSDRAEMAGEALIQRQFLQSDAGIVAPLFVVTCPLNPVELQLTSIFTSDCMRLYKGLQPLTKPVGSAYMNNEIIFGFFIHNIDHLKLIN